MSSLVLNLHDQASLVHPTAIVDPQAQIHSSVVIGPYCVIQGPVIIGAGTQIGSHVHIQGPTSIGEGNTIYSFAAIGCDSQDKKYKKETTSLIIGDRNTIREYATLSRGSDQQRNTCIGSDNLFMAYTHVAHDCQIGDHNTLANNASLAGHVEVGSYVGIGGMVGIHQFARVGSYAFIGGGSIVSKDIPPFVMASGFPAALMGLNTEGLKRRNFSEAQRQLLKSLYKNLFIRSTDLIATAKELLETISEEDRFAQILMEFVLTSSRGITR